MLLPPLQGSDLIIGSVDYSKPWIKLGKNSDKSKMMLLRILSNSSSGKKIMIEASHKAASTGKTLSDILIVGNGSITDTTLIRRFSKSNPEIVEYL